MATDEVLICTPKALPDHLAHAAAKTAVANNPANAPPHGLATALVALAGEGEAPAPTAGHLAVLVSRWWGSGGVRLSVGFMEETPTDLRDRILAHANAWSEFCNVSFAWTQDIGSAHVRITREQQGYWSYLGTDILSVPAGQPTMCFHGWSMNYPESEFVRVIEHEFGHTLGFPHEHLRPEEVRKLDRRRTIAYFGRTQGWSPQMVVQQVLTPLDPRAITAPGLEPTAPDETSIMCYQISGQCTKDRKPIVGGTSISAADRAFAARIYPRPGSTPQTPVMPPAS